LACFVVPAFATDVNRTLTQYLTDFWGPEKGFPADSVSSIAQTTDGYLWIGTDKGLVRFDGLNFRRFEPPSPGPFEIGAVGAVLADARGNLWILLQNTRLFRYHNVSL
jgi:ligand-binding sensor domain-containing protein